MSIPSLGSKRKKRNPPSSKLHEARTKTPKKRKSLPILSTSSSSSPLSETLNISYLPPPSPPPPPPPPPKHEPTASLDSSRPKKTWCLETLPIELLLLIFQFLDHPDLFRLLTVSTSIFPWAAKELWRCPPLDLFTVVSSPSFSKIVRSNHHFGNRISRSYSAVFLPYFSFITELHIAHLPVAHQLLLLRKSNLCRTVSAKWTASTAKALAEPHTCPFLISLSLVGRLTRFGDTKEYLHLCKVLSVKSKLTFLALDHLHICLLWILHSVMVQTQITSLTIMDAFVDPLSQNQTTHLNSHLHPHPHIHPHLHLPEEISPPHPEMMNEPMADATSSHEASSDLVLQPAWLSNASFSDDSPVFTESMLLISSYLRVCRISLLSLPHSLPTFFFKWIHASPFLKHFDLSFATLSPFLSMLPYHASIDLSFLFQNFPAHSSLEKLVLSSLCLTTVSLLTALNHLPPTYQNTSVKCLELSDNLHGDVVSKLIAFFPNLTSLGLLHVSLTPLLLHQLQGLPQLTQLTLDLFDERKFLELMQTLKSMPHLTHLDVYLDPMLLKPFNLFILIRELPQLHSFIYRCPLFADFELCIEDCPIPILEKRDRRGKYATFHPGNLQLLRTIELHHLNIKLKERPDHNTLGLPLWEFLMGGPTHQLVDQLFEVLHQDHEM